jgi:hypothetical protein
MSELDTMSLDELKEQATMLEISYPANILAETLIKKINAVLSGDDPEDAKPAKAAKAVAVPVEDKNKRVWIVIAEDPVDSQPAFVSVNGKSFRIKRGIPVEVPEYILYTLRSAKKSQLNPETKEWRQIDTFPFYLTEAPAA